MSKTSPPISFPRPPILERAGRLLIDGTWQPARSGRCFDSVNPSSGEVIAQIAQGGAEDIDAAVAAARQAFEGPWRKTKPAERQRLLLAIADLVERHYLQALEFGGPISVMHAGKSRPLGLLRFYAGLATAIHGQTIENSLPGEFLSYAMKEPIGVVGAITPWNGPLSVCITKIAPALAAGCTVVLKPSEEASLAALRLGELAVEAGVPAGVLNIVTGAGEAGAALAAHPGVDKIGFTGSTATGQAIIRASAGNVKRLSLELGGKSPDIVFGDADLDAAARGAAMAVFANSGQLCCAGSRLLVERSVHDDFVERVAEVGRSLKVGDSLDPLTQIGPLVSRKQLDRVCGYLAAGAREGATAISGGQRCADEALASGFFVPPTVFAGVHNGMSIAREEIFGPVVSAIPFDDMDEALAIANDTPFGLGAGVWTRDVTKAHRVSGALSSGTVWINCYLQMDPAIPFGGYRMSGYGREFGTRHVDEFMQVKSVVLNMA
ncbi:MAG: aldehyde dehydrogenase family protein [Variovorax sp.]|nr:MAG: aldehyde dehydrogenase family protein [Variovorax sp.]